MFDLGGNLLLLIGVFTLVSSEFSDASYGVSVMYSIKNI